MYPYNEDTGRINKIADAEYMIIGLSKCGTTTLYQSLRKKGITIKYHSNYTLERIYHTTELTTKKLLKMIKCPFTLFVPYREPIARKLSQHQQYQFGGAVKDFCLGDYSKFSDGFRTEVDEDLVFEQLYDATGINILEHHFDPTNGHTHIVNYNMVIIPYTLEKVDILAGCLGITLINGRISGAGERDIEFSRAELDQIYDTKYCKHFYSDEQIEEFKHGREDSNS